MLLSVVVAVPVGHLDIAEVIPRTTMEVNAEEVGPGVDPVPTLSAVRLAGIQEELAMSKSAASPVAFPCEMVDPG